MTTRVLFVDDDSRALDAYRRTLQSEFEVVTETHPDKALEVVKNDGPFSVVVSDLKMPVMDGIAFLSKVKDIAPDSVRILLTGYADFDNAVDAVNRGYIFRFLSKPCPPDLLQKTLWDASMQHELILAGHERHSLKRLKKLMNGIVEGLSTLVESRDPYTGGHQRRVAKLAVDIAEHLGFDSERMEALHIAGMLHDIGKVYVPSDFLNKPGRLNDQEFSVIRLHPEVGADILKSVEYDWPISEFIRQHHERLDGSGYPDGLKGEAIHLEARILAVADVVDAMSSRRPYRDSLGMEAAVTELKNNSGILYDKAVVGHCLSLIEQNKYNFEDNHAGRVTTSPD